MRSARTILAICILAALPVVPAFAGSDATVETQVFSCGNGIPGGINCIPSKDDLKEAHKAYARGLKLESHKDIAKAFVQFDDASRLVPENTQFFSAREVAKSQLVFRHTEYGDALLANNLRWQAAAEYRAALKIDPDNEYMQQRLAEALRDSAPASPAKVPALLADAAEIHLEPKAEKATFHYRGDVRGLYTELGSAYGVTIEFDDSVQSKNVRFYVDDVDFFTALHLAGRVSNTMWTALDAHQLLVAKDSPENHKQYDRMALATFVVPGASHSARSHRAGHFSAQYLRLSENKFRTNWNRGGARPAGHADGMLQANAPVDHRPPAGRIRYSRSTRSATTSPAKSACTFRTPSTCTTFPWRPWRHSAAKASHRSSIS